MPLKSFRDLRVWEAAIVLVERVYRITEGFPRHEVYALTSQVRRAAVSIPSNIAEGHTRDNRKEFLYFVSVARGSLAELETQLEIAARLRYFPQHELREILEEVASLGRQLSALRNALRASRSSRSP